MTHTRTTVLREIARFSLLMVIIFGTVLFPVQPLEARNEQTYTLAVVPQFPPSVIERNWRPLIERISAQAGIKIQLTFYRSISDFERDILKGAPDFTYLSPYHTVKARKAQGYIPLFRDGGANLVGILVVRKDSPARTVKDLKGAVIAFPSPNAFASSLYIQALLTRDKRLRFTPKYVTTHSNVYRHVLLGTVAAGGGVNTTLSREPQDLQDQLRILYQTPAVVSHAFCAHPRVPEAVRKTVTDAVLHLIADPSLQELLKAVEINKPIQASYERDYQPLERLDLEHHVVTDGE